ncbi:Methylthioribose-1-phosphate isomerase [Ignavibacterium album JCM 16511]|uniref:Methylthioribose-1-phosphate isomerase n=1 Tax=Ignavibacterium album (strain DSM 19864 / JCM 16511 / NBRC 101810 / Mat9-16) TaxID=945713 RepID=I0AKF9_IGNAJ|nr:S-methyl-5-thioribose-1-phosphate isomerase [Ignavibacterium album]AFH49466.1 Methylthioribose-1-phosphate isomerase [Ignavibacterium album JCM 16511]
MKNNSYFPLKFENDYLIFIDQTKLPLQENYISTDDYNRIAEAIERLEIRGAPLIGIAAAYACALAFKNKNEKDDNYFNKVYNRLASTRPTAVNLFYALKEIEKVYSSIDDINIYEYLLLTAHKIFSDEEKFSEKIAKNGLNIFLKRSNVLTHCNTGALATAGFGTAFAIVKNAFDHQLINHVYVDETRPLLQGLRLTAFELEKNEIPFTVQTDSSAAVLMQEGKIDLVITGADRIALNGDSANKIGTYNLAILCNFHNIPFYIAAPSTTIDRTIATGAEIAIEFRSSKELLFVGDKQIGKESYHCFCPAFDVTPSHLIRGIITEEGVFSFPYNFIR